MSGGAGVLALASVLPAVAAASLVARLRLSRLLDRLVAFGTLAVTQIELSLLISGAGFESLRRPTVLLVNVLLTAAALAYGHRDLRAWIERSWRGPDLWARLARSPCAGRPSRGRGRVASFPCGGAVKAHENSPEALTEIPHLVAR